MRAERENRCPKCQIQRSNDGRQDAALTHAIGGNRKKFERNGGRPWMRMYMTVATIGDCEDRHQCDGSEAKR